MNLENNFEIILINDFSEDESWKIIKSLATENNYVKGLNLKKNFGQHNAIMAGMNYCKGDNIITLDDDLQHPPEFMSDILKKLNDCEVCYTYYRNRKHIKWKKLVSKINNIISSFLLNKPFKIYLSSFRGLKKNVVSQIIKYDKANVYLDSLILNATKNIGMITVDHYARHKGTSNYNFKKLLVLWSDMVLNFNFYPIRFASFWGILLKYLVILFRKKKAYKQYELSEKTF